MKDKLIITITDVHGSKQYTLSQFLRIAISWIIISIGILIAIGIMVVNYLSTHVDTLEKDKEELTQQKEILIKQIIKSQETLQSMQEQLQEAKELIGIEADENNTIVKNDTLQKEDKKEDIIKDSGYLTLSEYTFLTRLIPNGKPLYYKRISTKFGFRRHPITKRKQLHSALDLTANVGTPIYAPADGVVVYAGKKKYYGNFLLLRHGKGFETAYGHLHKINVKTGQYVKKDDLIALCGNTGRSTGPHLHYEIRYLSKWLDPEPFMKEWDYKTYKDVMKKNKIVKWKKMIEDLRDELKLLSNCDKSKNTKNKGD